MLTNDQVQEAQTMIDTTLNTNKLARVQRPTGLHNVDTSITALTALRDEIVDIITFMQQ